MQEKLCFFVILLTILAKRTKFKMRILSKNNNNNDTLMCNLSYQPNVSI